MTLHELMMVVAIFSCTLVAAVEGFHHGMGWGVSFAAGGLVIGCASAWAIRRTVFWVGSLDSKHPKTSRVLAFLTLPVMAFGPAAFTMWMALKAAAHI